MKKRIVFSLFTAIVFLISTKVIAQCVNVALNKPATATSSWGVYTPDKAFDGNCGTNWNAGRHPTRSIMVDLQKSYSIEKIILQPEVSPDGNETYKIYTSTDMTTWTVADNFTLFVTNGMSITRSYAGLPLSNVRGVKIECTAGPSWVSFHEIGIYETQTSVNATITPSGSITLCKNDSVLLTASAGAKYLWNNGKTTQSIYAKQTGTYRVVVSSSNCLNTCSDTAYVTVNVDTVIAMITPPASICQGDSITLSASGGGSYLWNTSNTGSSITVSPVSSKTYSVIVSNNSCTDTATATVIVNPVPVAQITGTTTLCFGDSTTLIATGGRNYLWNTGDTITSIIRKPSADTTYSVIVSENACRDTVTVAITVNMPIANAGKDITICPNNSVQLNANGGTTYQWTSSQNLSNDTVSNPIAKPSSTTSYFVKVTDSNACIAYDTILVTVDTSLPVPQFTPKDLTGEVSLTVNFNNTTIGGSSYMWRFENENTSDKMNPSYTYTSAGTYPVMLIAYNSNGCADTAYGNIQIQDNGSELWLPSAFTPDEDGLNDLFGAKSTGIIEFQGMIFNRWGELIYEWDNVYKGWDGKYRNQEVPSGVYVYVVKAKGADNVIYQKTGHVALLR